MDPGPCCVVDEKTQIYLEAVPIKRKKEEESLREVGWEDIGGYRQELEKIQDTVSVFF